MLTTSILPHLSKKTEALFRLHQAKSSYFLPNNTKLSLQKKLEFTLEFKLSIKRLKKKLGWLNCRDRGSFFSRPKCNAVLFVHKKLQSWTFVNF